MRRIKPTLRYKSRMRIPLYQIDAFTSRLFSGNPAAVCPLEDWLEDGVLQAIAAENNLSETAFFVKRRVIIKGSSVKYLEGFVEI